jgi:glycosyltransferase involved in cell wall biosynthesis
MHVNFILYGCARTGGSMTFMEIGKRLIQKGHKVTITTLNDCLVETENGFKPNYEIDSPIEFIPVPVNIPLEIVQYFANFQSEYKSIFQKFEINKRPHLIQFAVPIAELIKATPQCDINIATYFPTSFAVSESKIAELKFYYMQHYEALCVRPGDFSWLAEQSYSLPLNKISNCSWLQSIVKKIHKADSYLINHSAKSEYFYPMNLEKFENPTILSLGKTIMFWKGLQELDEALFLIQKEIPNIQLLLYGSEKTLNIRFPHKYIMKPSYDELRELYNKSHVVVCPSWYESFPAPPLEAMGCGTPMITTKIGVEDYAINEVNSLVIEPKSPTQIKDAVIRIFKDNELKNKIINGGLKTFKEFSWDKTTDKLEALFLDKLKNNQKCRPIKILGK